MTATDSMQEYLAEAFRIAYYQPEAPYVSTSALAEEMHVSAPAVTRMVQRLKHAGFLEHEPYRGIRLTEAGEREALANIRRHRLVERFLVDVMGFGWHEVHDDADDMGLVVSDVLVDKMDEMSGFPKRCPHGEPIPSADGVMPRVIDFPLSEVEVGPRLRHQPRALPRRAQAALLQRIAFGAGQTVPPGDARALQRSLAAAS